MKDPHILSIANVLMKLIFNRYQRESGHIIIVAKD